MTEMSLRDFAILVVEDEFLLADDICFELTKREATVIGPAASVEQGIALLNATEGLSGAVLDVNLRGEPVFPLADALLARGLPFVFATGYDASVIPDRFQHVPRCEKPVRLSRVVEALGRAAGR